MQTFTDYYNNKVTLSFDNHPFSLDPKHVWVICKYKENWLLTKHKDRGLEFPGGKVEMGETAEQAAIREVKEETGGIVKTIDYIGQYFVKGKGGNIIKNVYFATIYRLVDAPTYFETDGPALLQSIPDNVRTNHLYSFIMKDDVLPLCINFLQKEDRL